MSIDWFNFEEDDSKELPWLREFIESGGDYDTPIPVEACSVSIKGILVLTDCWKAFIFKNSKLHSQLIEALEEYAQTKVTLPKLVAVGEESAKIRLGLDQMDLTATWKKEKQMYYQRYNDPEEFVKRNRNKSPNPLLPNPSLQGGASEELPNPTPRRKKST